MNTLYICENCQTAIAEFACLCGYPLALLCAMCKTYPKHSNYGHDQVPLKDALLITSESKRHEAIRLRQCISHLRATERTLAEAQTRLESCYNEAIARLRAVYSDLSSRLKAAKDIVASEVDTCAQLISVHGLEPEWQPEPLSLAEVIMRERNSPDISILLSVHCVVSSDTDRISKLFTVSLDSNFPLSKEAAQALKALKLSSQPENRLYACSLARISANYLYLSSPGSIQWTFRTPLVPNIHCEELGTVACFLSDTALFMCGGYEVGLRSKVSRTAYIVDTTGGVKRLVDMQTPRAYAGVVGFQGSPYVFGGINCLCEPIKQSQHFSESAWTNLPNMNAPRSNFTPCILQQRLYLCGCGSIDVYNLNTNSMRLLSITLPEPSPCVACLLGEEMVVLGSEFLTRFREDEGELRQVGGVRHANGWVVDTCCQPRGQDGKLYVVRAGQICICDGLTGKPI